MSSLTNQSDTSQISKWNKDLWSRKGRSAAIELINQTLNQYEVKKEAVYTNLIEIVPKCPHINQILIYFHYAVVLFIKVEYINEYSSIYQKLGYEHDSNDRLVPEYCYMEKKCHNIDQVVDELEQLGVLNKGTNIKG